MFEATTLLLLLCVAVPLKHFGGWSTGVRVMGPVHGLAFVAFLWTVLQTIAGDPANWSSQERVRLIVFAFVPFGGFCNLPLLSRKVNGLRAERVDA